MGEFSCEGDFLGPVAGAVEVAGDEVVVAGAGTEGSAVAVVSGAA